MKKLILILLILPIQAQADFIEEYGLFEPFDTVDWVMQGVFTTLVYIDARQTIRFLNDNNPNTYETNIALGENPSDQKVYNMIAIGVLAQYLICWAMPKDLRIVWQLNVIILEIDAVEHNRASNEFWNDGGSPIVVFGYKF